MSAEAENRLKSVKSILVTQLITKDNCRPYDRLVEKYNLKIDYRPFTEVQSVSAREFRKQKINLENYTAIILNSKSDVNHFFRICGEMRFKVPKDLKYFCTSEAVALYLQKYIVYRKRKVLFGDRTLQNLKPILLRYRKKEKFLLPCSNLGRAAFVDFLTEKNFNFKDSVMYKAVSSDISDLKNVSYDIIVFFSPLSLSALYENFPEFKQNHTRIAAFGPKTSNAVLDRGLTLDISAPQPGTPSMTMAIEKYINRTLE